MPAGAAAELGIICLGGMAAAVTAAVRRDPSQAENAALFPGVEALIDATVDALMPLIHSELRRLPCEGTALRYRAVAS